LPPRGARSGAGAGRRTRGPVHDEEQPISRPDTGDGARGVEGRSACLARDDFHLPQGLDRSPGASRGSVHPYRQRPRGQSDSPGMGFRRLATVVKTQARRARRRAHGRRRGIGRESGSCDCVHEPASAFRVRHEVAPVEWSRTTPSSAQIGSRSLRFRLATAWGEARGNVQGRSEPSGRAGLGKEGTGERK
jgi:hypothetical protein